MGYGRHCDERDDVTAVTTIPLPFTQRGGGRGGGCRPARRAPKAGDSSSQPSHPSRRHRAPLSRRTCSTPSQASGKSTRCVLRGTGLRAGVSTRAVVLENAAQGTSPAVVVTHAVTPATPERPDERALRIVGFPNPCFRFGVALGINDMALDINITKRLRRRKLASGEAVEQLRYVLNWRDPRSGRARAALLRAPEGRPGEARRTRRRL